MTKLSINAPRGLQRRPRASPKRGRIRLTRWFSPRGDSLPPSLPPSLSLSLSLSLSRSLSLSLFLSLSLSLRPGDELFLESQGKNRDSCRSDRNVARGSALSAYVGDIFREPRRGPRKPRRLVNPMRPRRKAPTIEGPPASLGVSLGTSTNCQRMPVKSKWSLEYGLRASISERSLFWGRDDYLERA
jgi:hypothetical protein